MVKKITISVPDDLHEKMQEWKGEFNFSKVFQQAMSEQIEKRERFISKLEEYEDIDAIIKRLRKENEEESMDLFNDGKTAGVEFAKHANLQEIKYALKWKFPNTRSRNVINWNPCNDELIGIYFQDAINDNPALALEETIQHNYVPSKNLIKWLKGWKEGVKDFWLMVKDKI
jgi:predicted CopG family antitoxin